MWIKAITHHSPITEGLELGRALKIPIAHAEGRYFADEKTLDELERNDQVLFHYCDANGNETADSNPNHAMCNIGSSKSRSGQFGTNEGQCERHHRAAADAGQSDEHTDDCADNR